MFILKIIFKKSIFIRLFKKIYKIKTIIVFLVFTILVL